MSTTPRAKCRILVIDDDAALRDILSLSLAEEGYDVRVAENGAVAMEILKTEVFGVFLVDLVMPKMDGLRFLTWLRTEAKNTAPALVFSGSFDARGGIEKEALAAGATALLIKPVDFPVLLKTLDRLVSRA